MKVRGRGSSVVLLSPHKDWELRWRRVRGGREKRCLMIGFQFPGIGGPGLVEGEGILEGL